MMSEIKWGQLKPQERDRLVHQQVMQQPLDVLCEGQLDVYMGNYWGCTCGWVSTFSIGSDESTKHTIPVPAYSQSMDAAWMVVGYTFQHAPLPNNFEFIRWLERLHLWGLSKEYVLEHIYVLALRAFDVEVDFS